MTDKMELLKRTKLFVLDMDGTFYLGNQILPGAADFLKAVEKAGKQYLFLPIILPARPGTTWQSWKRWAVPSPGTRS